MNACDCAPARICTRGVTIVGPDAGVLRHTTWIGSVTTAFAAMSITTPSSTKAVLRSMNGMPADAWVSQSGAVFGVVFASASRRLRTVTPAGKASSEDSDGDQ